MFSFRNPGMMRGPIDTALHGGQSDCRNRTLQKMFRFISLGENAGSGLPKIIAGWQSQHWRMPIIRLMPGPQEHTALELHMLSLVPEQTLQVIKEGVGRGTVYHLPNTQSDYKFKGLEDNSGDLEHSSVTSRDSHC